MFSGANIAVSVALTLLIGCGDAVPTGVVNAVPPELVVPVRAATIGDAAWRQLPANAEVVIELDLARARANPVVGSVVQQLLAQQSDASSTELPLGFASAPLQAMDAVVLAAYSVGTRDAATITLLLPSEGVEVATLLPNAIPLKDGWVALAPDAFASRLSIQEGQSLAEDRELTALRARAMPAKATGAVLRATAKLDGVSRTTLANLLVIEPAPRLVSAWGDIADDAVMVVEIDGSSERDHSPAERVSAGVNTVLAMLRANSTVRSLGLAPSFERTTRVDKFEPWVRVVLEIYPDPLRRAVSRARLGLEAAPPIASQAAPP